MENNISQKIIHNETAHRFEYAENNATAFIEYSLHNSSIDFVHTIVPDSLSGKGIASALTEYAFKYAKEKNIPVIVHCPYILAYLKRHPELNEQLNKQFHKD